MHIPDGYLSPQTTIPASLIMFVVWYLAFRRANLLNNQQKIPLLALCAAFSFIIMMFNVPIVGGSSAHAVGAVLVAILIGPVNAILAISTTLIIQALIFGDGGIMALGINCFNMAVVMPLSGYWIYRLILSQSANSNSKIILIATGIASYIGLNLAALFTAIELGIQPLFFTNSHGLPLYGFYPLSVTIPAMMFAHLFFAAPLEAAISVMTMAYMLKFAPNLLGNSLSEIKDTKPLFNRYIISGLLGLIILTPLGLLAQGTAFGEWSGEEVKQLLGYVPQGMQQQLEQWHALIPDYSISFFQNNAFTQASGYILSAVIGSAIIGLFIISINQILRLIRRKVN
ncbi:MAG: hypothetical protein RLZZ293_131 [Pseudomonadota bacterium]|jgi:cobalt/nickel transport system permease protein